MAVRMILGVIIAGTAFAGVLPSAGESPVPHASNSVGETPEAGSASEDWTFVFMPYLWFLRNDLVIGTDEYLQSDVTSFQEALSQYDYGALFFFEAHRKKWAVYADTQFVKLSDSGRDRGFKFDSVVKQVVAEAAAVRKFGHGAMRFDFLGGVRYFWLDTNVRVRFIDEFHDTFTWVEPLAGVRVTAELGRRWTVQVRGDAGGFDLGSDFTWQINARLHYRIGDRYDLSFGYRHLDIDHRDGEEVYDNTMSGPLVGLRMTF